MATNLWNKVIMLDISLFYRTSYRIYHIYHMFGFALHDILMTLGAGAVDCLSWEFFFIGFFV